MLTVCYAAKGGSGTTVTSAALALAAPASAMLVDLAGDALDVLGVPDDQQPGLNEWVRSSAEVDALVNLLIAATDACAVLPSGGPHRPVPEATARVPVPTAQQPTTNIAAAAAFAAVDQPETNISTDVDLDHGLVDGSDGERYGELWRWLADRPEAVVVDAGCGAPPAALLEHADEVLLVTRACYLAMRHAHAAPVTPTGIVVLREPGRSFSSRDIAATLGVPVVADIPVDPAVARAVDAGLLAMSLPRSLHRAVRKVLR